MTIANDDFSLPSPCFIFATSLPSSSQPGMQPCLGTHTWSPDLWSHYYTPNHCTVRPVSGRPIGLYTFCTRILTYSFASRMVYVTPGESYDVSPCHLPFCVFFANQLDTFQHAVDIARESFIELRDVEREQFILDVHVLANTSAVAATRMATTTLPHSGYISPEAMATCLATLFNLDTLVLDFQSPRSLSYRENWRPLPHTNLVLPALTTFEFQGFSEYLKGFLYY